jgi:hypothetical protein
VTSPARFTFIGLGVLGIATIGCLVWWFAAPSSLEARANETGPIEWGTAVCYLLAAVGFGWAAVRGVLGRFWMWGLAIASFLACGEELSWGQHVFHYGSPEALRKDNVQGEFNLHNLNGVSQNIRAVALVLLVAGFVLLPFAYRMWPEIRRTCERYRVPIYPYWPMGWWLVGAAFMVVPRVLGGPQWALDELGELYVSAGVLLYGVLSFLAFGGA